MTTPAQRKRESEMFDSTSEKKTRWEKKERENQSSHISQPTGGEKRERTNRIIVFFPDQRKRGNGSKQIKPSGEKRRTRHAALWVATKERKRGNGRTAAAASAASGGAAATSLDIESVRVTSSPVWFVCLQLVRDWSTQKKS